MSKIISFEELFRRKKASTAGHWEFDDILPKYGIGICHRIDLDTDPDFKGRNPVVLQRHIGHWCDREAERSGRLICVKASPREEENALHFGIFFYSPQTTKKGRLVKIIDRSIIQHTPFTRAMEAEAAESVPKTAKKKKTRRKKAAKKKTTASNPVIPTRKPTKRKKKKKPAVKKAVSRRSSNQYDPNWDDED